MCQCTEFVKPLQTPQGKIFQPHTKFLITWLPIKIIWPIKRIMVNVAAPLENRESTLSDWMSGGE